MTTKTDVRLLMRVVQLLSITFCSPTDIDPNSGRLVPTKNKLKRQLVSLEAFLNWIYLIFAFIQLTSKLQSTKQLEHILLHCIKILLHLLLSVFLSTILEYSEELTEYLRLLVGFKELNGKETEADFKEQDNKRTLLLQLILAQILAVCILFWLFYFGAPTSVFYVYAQLPSKWKNVLTYLAFGIFIEGRIIFSYALYLLFLVIIGFIHCQACVQWIRFLWYSYDSSKYLSIL